MFYGTDSATNCICLMSATTMRLSLYYKLCAGSVYHNPTPLSYTTSPHHPLTLISHQNNNHTYKNAFIMAVVWGSNLSWRLKQTKPRIIHLIQRLPEYTPICLICIYIAHCGVIPRTKGSNFGYQWRARINNNVTFSWRCFLLCASPRI